MNLRSALLSLAAASTLLSREADAADQKPERQVSVTISPIHLIFPIVEITAEYAVTRQIGVAAILGYGTISIPTQRITAAGISTTTEKIRAYELGAHFNYYVLGNFDHGMQLGVEALYVGVAGDGPQTTGITASGLALGPYVGYKIITNVGFTFEANGGAQYVTLRGSNANNGDTASQKKVIPLVNLNIGWSF